MILPIIRGIISERYSLESSGVLLQMVVKANTELFIEAYYIVLALGILIFYFRNLKIYSINVGI